MTGKTAGKDATSIHELFESSGKDYVDKFLDNFWEKVDVGAKDECWRWEASIGSSGYGFIGFQRESLQPHRVSKYLDVREPIDDVQCNHRCGNGWCVNPDHIYLGTATDNAHDVEWEEKDTTVLTKQDAEEIRERYSDEDISQRKLGAEYGIRQEQVSKIVNRKQWK